MRVVIQRVSGASVSVDGEVVSAIGEGLLLLSGFGKMDNEATIRAMAEKIIRFRLFQDNNGKMNHHIMEISGQILSVPQFTLLGDTKRGNRPGFDAAAAPVVAEELWNEFNSRLEELGADVSKGVFGAHMEVKLVNEGPVTFVLDK